MQSTELCSKLIGGGLCLVPLGRGQFRLCSEDIASKCFLLQLLIVDLAVLAGVCAHETGTCLPNVLESSQQTAWIGTDHTKCCTISSR